MVKRSFGRLFDDVVGYLNLYDYIKLKAIDLTGKSKEISLPSFWYSVLGDKFSGAAQTSFAPLKPGDIVTVKDVFITD